MPRPSFTTGARGRRAFTSLMFKDDACACACRGPPAGKGGRTPPTPSENGEDPDAGGRIPGTPKGAPSTAPAPVATLTFTAKGE